MPKALLRLMPAVFIAVVVIVGVASSLYKVRPGQAVLLLRGGKVVATVSRSGSHWKIPFVESVVYVDTGVHLSSARVVAESDSGGEKGFAMNYSIAWTVTDPERYFAATDAGEDIARSRLTETAGRTLRKAIGSSPVQFLRASAQSVKDSIWQSLKPVAAKLGIDVLGVELGAADIPKSVKEAAAQKMAAAVREKLSAMKQKALQSSTAIRQAATRQARSIVATASEEALQIRTGSDTKAARIYADAAREAPDFFRFYHALESEQRQLTANTRVIVISTESPWFEALHRTPPQNH